ncbi:MAG: oligopeptide transport system ATP-binding protein [Thermomicrobiales bacterium]|nr:oligopeptide transport system ATP-binding protein [Thermomicrobiales bacterium]
MNPVLSVRNLKTQFFTRAGVVFAVDDVSFDVMPGETIGIVGESGCGKSVTSLSIMRLIPSPPGRIVGGEILLNVDGKTRDLAKISDREMRQVRGNDIAMIFQDPMTSLNPVYTVGNQIAESLMLHLDLSADEAERRAIELLKRVGIPAAEQRIHAYPHQFSGGMRQRVMIAIALACNPKVLIADEPTTALDVTIQAQILDLMGGLNRDFGTAIVLITHDLGVVAEVCQRVIVMYAGKIVEQGSAKDLFANPQHPYTIGLLRSIPRLGERVKDTLATIGGLPPDLLAPPTGCRFRPRCPRRQELCEQEPPLAETQPGQRAACWFPGPDAQPVAEASAAGTAVSA